MRYSNSAWNILIKYTSANTELNFQYIFAVDIQFINNFEYFVFKWIEMLQASINYV